MSDLLLELIKQHAEDDTRRFDALAEMLTEVRKDVKVLVEARNRSLGAWATITGISTVVSIIVGIFVKAWK